MTDKEKALKLLNEHRKEFSLMSNRKRTGFIRRCKNLMNKTECLIAITALDIIATRGGFDYVR